MKNFLYIFLVLIIASCDSDSANDCIQAAGSRISKEYSIGDFSKIRIEDEVSLYIKQGTSQKIILETGENLLNDISVTIEDETLVIKDHNSCNLVRDYGITKVYVTTPNITEIRNSSAYDVFGQGVLNFSKLSLVSNSTAGPETIKKGGDFTLEINADVLNVSANGESVFYISGTVRKASLNFLDEIPRFEGENLSIDDLTVFQRSANKMIVNPQKSISGKILGTGDIISYNRPPIVDVKESYTGRLIFKD